MPLTLVFSSSVLRNLYQPGWVVLPWGTGEAIKTTVVSLHSAIRVGEAGDCMATEYGVVQVGLIEGAGTALGEAVSISKATWLVCHFVSEKDQAYSEPDYLRIRNTTSDGLYYQGEC